MAHLRLRYQPSMITNSSCTLPYFYLLIQSMIVASWRTKLRVEKVNGFFSIDTNYLLFPLQKLNPYIIIINIKDWTL